MVYSINPDYGYRLSGCFGFGAGKHPVVLYTVAAKALTRYGKVFDAFGIGQSVLDNIAAHHAGPSGKETDDFVYAVFLVFEDWRNDAGIGESG